MQEQFLDSEPLRKAFINSLSAERFATYNRMAKGDELTAIKIYRWNSELSQSLWFPLQAWEICLRNKLNNFLCWKFNKNWPYDTGRALRQLKVGDQRRLSEARERQEQARKVRPAPLGAIVADLSSGFWVSLLSGGYDVPFVWRSNLPRIFPNDRTLQRPDAWGACDRLLDLRNRIAHHEPILHMPLPQRHAELGRIVAAMCQGTSAYCASSCSFAECWARWPSLLTKRPAR
jgi:hypothetical protein